MIGPRQGVQRAAVAALVTVLLMLWACATAPVTGRPELLLVPESQEIALGVKAYRETLAKAKLSQDPQINGLVNSVGRRIAAAADHIGLILMAKAGYDPREAPKVFERMMAGRHEQGPPTFLSTHPADAERIRELQALMPEALEYYRH